MVRSIRDVAISIEALLDETTRSRLPNGVYTSFFNCSFDGIKIGFVNPTLWRVPPDLWVPSEEVKEQHVRVTPLCLQL
jgi:amidase